MAGNLEKPLLSLYGTEWRERCYGLRSCPTASEDLSNAERLKLDFAERDKCKPVLLRLSLAGNLEKPLMSLYGTRAGHR